MEDTQPAVPARAETAAPDAGFGAWPTAAAAAPAPTAAPTAPAAGNPFGEPYPYDPYRPYDPYHPYGAPPTAGPYGSSFGPPAGTQTLPPPPPGTLTAPAGPADRQKKVRTMVLAAVGALVVGFGGFFLVRALTSHSTPVAATGPVATPAAGARNPAAGGFARRGGTAGTITAINGSTITLASNRGGTVTVDTSSSTTVTKSTAGTVGNVAQGDNVVVIGTTTGSGITAFSISDSGSSPVPAGRRGATLGAGAARLGVAEGTVTGIKGGTLTVKEPDGTTASVTTTSTTTVTLQQPSSVSALTTNERIRVTGSTNSDGSIAATTIVEGTAGLGGRAGGFGGFFGGGAG